MKIQLQFLTKKFDEEAIFRIKHYEFQAGMVHGIIGANGVGKTTLLRILAGLDQAYQGSVTYDGSIYSDAMAKKLTYISQKPYMLNRTIYENVAYPLRIRKWPAKELKKRVEEILEIMDLQTISKRNANVLSAGEREKVSLARGLVFNPDIILMDEPTANIDPEKILIIEQMIMNYQRKYGATIIMVTHNLAQALRMCDTLSVMKDQGIESVSKDELYQSVENLNQVKNLIRMDYQVFEV